MLDIVLEKSGANRWLRAGCPQTYKLVVTNGQVLQKAAFPGSRMVTRNGNDWGMGTNSVWEGFIVEAMSEPDFGEILVHQ